MGCSWATAAWSIRNTSRDIVKELFRFYLALSTEIAEQAGIWRQEYKSRGQSIGTPDTVIAATAYLHDYSLVTNNTKDYPMPELKLYKYMQEKAA